ncbi:hypothetical protein EON78_07345 [bacterium]|nr:MAG: hypothetical protein EON78_07345 [bacterium]
MIEHYDEDFLHCSSDNRKIQLEVNHFSDRSSSTHIHFLENNITLFQAEIGELEIDLTKNIITEWLIKRIHHNRFLECNQYIVKDEIYDAYVKGEVAMIEYHWQKVKDSFQDNRKIIEIIELCQQSAIIKKFIPFISIGRLCVSNSTVYQPYNFNCNCINYINNEIEVADYKCKTAKKFNSPKEAIEYLERLESLQY